MQGMALEFKRHRILCEKKIGHWFILSTPFQSHNRITINISRLGIESICGRNCWYDLKLKIKTHPELNLMSELNICHHQIYIEFDGKRGNFWLYLFRSRGQRHQHYGLGWTRIEGEGGWGSTRSVLTAEKILWISDQSFQLTWSIFLFLLGLGGQRHEQDRVNTIWGGSTTRSVLTSDPIC